MMRYDILCSVKGFEAYETMGGFFFVEVANESSVTEQVDGAKKVDCKISEIWKCRFILSKMHKKNISVVAKPIYFRWKNNCKQACEIYFLSHLHLPHRLFFRSKEFADVVVKLLHLR